MRSASPSLVTRSTTPESRYTVTGPWCHRTPTPPRTDARAGAATRVSACRQRCSCSRRQTRCRPLPAHRPITRNSLRMTDPHNAQGHPNPSGWQPSYPARCAPEPAGRSVPAVARPAVRRRHRRAGRVRRRTRPIRRAPAAAGGPSGARSRRGSSPPVDPARPRGRHRFVVALARGRRPAARPTCCSFGSSGDSATTADTRPITMPDTLGGLGPPSTVTADKAGADKAKCAARRRTGRTIERHRRRVSAGVRRRRRPACRCTPATTWSSWARRSRSGPGRPG